MKIRIMMFLIAALFLVSSAAAQKTLKMDLKVDRTTPLIKALTANEQAAWKHLVDKKYDDFGKFFADDYLGVYDTETTTKTSEIAEDKQINFKSAAVTDIKVKVLDENNAIVTSNVKADMILPDGQNLGGDFRATTFWVRRANAWLIVYHSHILIKQ
jgi:hypothetical protein